MSQASSDCSLNRWARPNASQSSMTASETAEDGHNCSSRRVVIHARRVLSHLVKGSHDTGPPIAFRVFIMRRMMPFNVAVKELEHQRRLWKEER